MAKKFLDYRLKDFSSLIGLDLSYFIGGGSWLLGSMILTTIGGIFLSVLFARLLSKEVFGEYSFLMSILGFAALTGLPGMTQAVIQASAENKDGLFKKAIYATLKWSSLGALVLLFLSVYFYFSNKQSLSLAIILSALAFPIGAACSLFNAFLTGKKQFRLVAIYGTLAQFASISATSIALLLFPTLILVSLFSAWSTTIANMMLTIFVFKKVKNDKSDKELIDLGYHLSISQVFTIGADYLDRLLIPLFLGFTNNATYAFAILIPMQIHGFLKVFMTLGQPKVAELSSKDLKLGFIKKSLQFEILVCAIVLGYILTAPTIFRILYPAYKGDAVIFSQIFSLSLLYFPGNILSLLFIRKRNSAAIHKINVVYALTTTVSLIILVPIFGLAGAVFAKVTARMFQMLVQIVLFLEVKTGEN